MYKMVCAVKVKMHVDPNDISVISIVLLKLGKGYKLQDKFTVGIDGIRYILFCI